MSLQERLYCLYCTGTGYVLYRYCTQHPILLALLAPADV